MRRLIVLGIAFAGFGICTVNAQSDKKSELESYNAEEMKENDSAKPTIVVIGMNLINSDGSSMGIYVLNEHETQKYSAVSKDLHQKGIDNKKYAKAMKTGKYAEAEELNTCKLSADNKDERN